MKGTDVTYPKDHEVGMRVPKGGSDCKKCEYLRPKAKCGNDSFVRWQGSDSIPGPVDEYCCDFFETMKPDKKDNFFG